MPDFGLDLAVLRRIAGLSVTSNFLGSTDTQTVYNKTVDSTAPVAAGTIGNNIRSIYQPNKGTRNKWGNIFACPGGVLGDGPMLNLVTYYNSSINVFFDTTEGNYCTFVRALGTANLLCGMATTQVVVTRLAALPNIICRIKNDITANSRFYFGFSSNGGAPPSTTDTMLANGDSGIMIGFRTTDTQYQIFNNSGGGAYTVTTSGVNMNTTGWHTLQIVVTSTSNVVFIVDGTTVTKTTNLPASTTLMAFYLAAATTDTTHAANLSFAYCNGEANNV